LAAHDTVNTDVLGHSLYFVAEYGESVNHVIDGLLQDEYLSLGLDVDLAAHVAVGNGLSDGRNTSHLEKRMVSKGPTPEKGMV
jgi:hypothetical protein